MQWRPVLLVSCGLAVLQLLTSGGIDESPVWLSRQGQKEKQFSVARRLWIDASALQFEAPRPSFEEPLLGDSERHLPETHTAAISAFHLLKSRELRRPLLVVAFVMLAQQLSGINAVMYYSNEILANTLPQWGPYISLLIAAVNVLMTFPPIFLIERMGRTRLLQVSFVGALVSLLAVGFGLDTGLVALASIAILTFVMSFAIGLGPIPLIIIPEVSPPHAVSALASVGLSLSWTSNFFVGLAFLPLRNYLSSGEPMKEGRVFYVFAALLCVTTFALSRVCGG